MEEKIIRDLLKHAREVSERAYAPYSRFHVGCAILLADDRVIVGINIENAAYSVTLCAERSAMAQVISLGLQDQIKALAVVTRSSPPGSPCGMCRQFLLEFLKKDTPIILGNFSDSWSITTMQELLPRAFDKSDLLS